MSKYMYIYIYICIAYFFLDSNMFSDSRTPGGMRKRLYTIAERLARVTQALLASAATARLWQVVE